MYVYYIQGVRENVGNLPDIKKTREKNTTSSYKRFSYRPLLRRYGLLKSSNGIKFFTHNY